MLLDFGWNTFKKRKKKKEYLTLSLKVKMCFLKPENNLNKICNKLLIRITFDLLFKQANYNFQAWNLRQFFNFYNWSSLYFHNRKASGLQARTHWDTTKPERIFLKHGELFPLHSVIFVYLRKEVFSSSSFCLPFLTFLKYLTNVTNQISQKKLKMYF